MPKIISNIIKQKKVIFIAFLLLSVGLFFIPQQVSAFVSATPVTTTGTTVDNPTKTSQTSKDVNTSGPDRAGEADFGWNIFKGFFVAIFRFILWLCWSLADLAAKLFSFIFDETRKMIITKDKTFSNAWTLVRDLANMIIVLGFIVIGVATSLRIQEYAAKKLLGKLIAIALLINFSGLFCGIIIDGSNIIFNNLAGNAGGQGNSIVDAIAKGGRQQMDKTFVENNVLLFANIAIIHSVTYIAVAITFLYMAALLIIRYAILAILYILSPIAFTFWAFPASKKLFSDWWNHFLKWCFVAIAGGFFLTIAAKIIEATDALSNTSTVTNVAQLNMRLIVGLIFMIVGFKMTAKSSGIAAMAATAVMGAVTGGAGLAARGALGAAKGTGLAGMATRAGQHIKDGATAAGQRMGVIKKGTLEANKADRLKEPMSRLENITDNKKLAKIAEQGTWGNANRAAEKAAAAQILAKRNAFGEIDPNKRDSVAAHAQSFGVAKETFTKGAPETGAAATDKEATDYAKTKYADSLVKGGVSRKDADARANKAFAATGGASFKDSAVKDAHKEIRDRRIMENALNISPVSDVDVENRLKEDKRKELFDAGNTAPQVDEAMRKTTFTDADRVKTKGVLSDEKIKKSVKKLQGQKILELPSEAMPAFAEHAGENAMVHMLRNGSDDHVAKFKKAYGDILRSVKGDHVKFKEYRDRYDAAVARAYKKEKEDEEESDIGGEKDKPSPVSGGKSPF